MMRWADRCYGLCKKRRNIILDPSRRVPSFAHQDTTREGKVEKKPNRHAARLCAPIVHGPGPSHRPQSPVPTHLREAASILRAHEEVNVETSLFARA